MALAKNAVTPYPVFFFQLVHKGMIFYKKVGRRYVPVHEYDQTLMDSFPKGSHLVICYPGGQSTRYNVDPAHAPLIAASRVAEDAMCQAISKASEMRPTQTPITEGQRAAWKNLAREFGNELATLNVNSARDKIGRAHV